MANLDFNTYDNSGLDSIDDGFSDDIFKEPEDPITVEPNPDPDQNDFNHTDEYSTISREYLDKYLQSNGIKDINNITFEDEDGKEYTKRFDELTDEEKVNILRGDIDEYDLSDDEVNLLNIMRSNNLDSKGLEDYLAKYYWDLFQKQYTPQEPQYNYAIDDISDDELYVADLKSRFPNATDDELIRMFEQNKQDESLYTKAVADLRTFYRQKEDDMKKQQEEEIERQRQQQEYAYQNDIQQALQNFDNIGELELEPTDKQQILKVLTDFDNSGNRAINTMLQDPNNLVKVAWFLLHGENSINGLSDYYKKEIANSRRTQTNKTNVRSVTLPKPRQVNNKTISSIDDLDF